MQNPIQTESSLPAAKRPKRNSAAGRNLSPSSLLTNRPSSTLQAGVEVAPKAAPAAVAPHALDLPPERITAIIRNCRKEHGICSMARGRYGMAEYGRLAPGLAMVDAASLATYLDLIDEIRDTHRQCHPCSLKFVAFCMAFCRGRLPERFADYAAEYKRLREGFEQERDFHAEVAAAIYKAGKEGKPRPTNTKFFHEAD